MFFKYYNNSLNQMSRGFAKGLFVIGLLLAGFGVLVYILKEVLAVIAAAIFMVVGFFCCVNAIRIYILSRKLNNASDPNDDHRENVRVRIDTDADVF
ncbi:MAG: hypothetical protein K8R02_01435 [Anaerohalosphaeraceae bacterium]|nr:hypothetical protein [Anaerohalosphaeraceae bacterium]